MNNKRIIDSLSRICSDKGYRLVCGARHEALADKTARRSAWLTVPKLSSVEGRSHGRARYSIELRLSDRTPTHTRNDMVAMSDKLESDMLAIFAELSRSAFVALVDKLAIAPAVGALRPDIGTSAVAEAVVETIF